MSSTNHQAACTSVCMPISFHTGKLLTAKCMIYSVLVFFD